MLLSIVFRETNPNIGFGYTAFSENYHHPFYLLEDLEKSIDKYDKYDFLKKTYSFHQNIQKTVEDAFFNFRFELNLCPKYNKSPYINEVVRILYFLYTRVEKKNRSRNKNLIKDNLNIAFTKSYFPLYQFLLDAYYYCIEKIADRYSSLLNNESKKILLDIISPAEPILSFKINKEIPDNLLKESFENRLIKKELINVETEFSNFKTLFLGQPLREKIEWISTLGALYYFITLLIKEDDNGRKAIQDPKNKHWQITSEFFSYDGGKRVPNLKRQKPPRKQLRRPIELFVNDLNSLT